MRLIDADYALHKMDTTNLQPRTETERVRAVYSEGVKNDKD